MSDIYEYSYETTIDRELICNICMTPFTDPVCCTSCGETLCRKCIAYLIEMRKDSCPNCRQKIMITRLNNASRPLQSMLDQLDVKCTVCGQTNIQRGNFNDHIDRVCPKMVVSCSASDIKCPWRGQRDQLHRHLINCQFEPMRPVFNQFIIENQQLKDKINLKDTSIESMWFEQNRLKSRIEELENANRLLEEQLEQLTTIDSGEQIINQ